MLKKLVKFGCVMAVAVAVVLPQQVLAQTPADSQGWMGRDAWSQTSVPESDWTPKSIKMAHMPSTIQFDSDHKAALVNSLMPVKAKVTSRYGRRLHPISKRYKLHQGDDYAAPMGTPILAPAAGVVTFVGRKGGYGNTVMLRHSERKETLYAHMSRASKGLKVGELVQAGEKIGYVGSTGMSTGPHLHFEVWKDGKRINPAHAKLPQMPLDEQDAHLLRTHDKAQTAPVNTIQM